MVVHERPCMHHTLDNTCQPGCGGEWTSGLCTGRSTGGSGGIVGIVGEASGGQIVEEVPGGGVYCKHSGTENWMGV